MANLSNINNILRTNSTGVGIFADAGSYPLEISSAGTAGIKLLNTAGATYDVYANASEEFIIAKNGVGNRLTISSAGDTTFGGQIRTTVANSNTLYSAGYQYTNGTYVAFRQGTANDWNVDTYNGNSYLNALKIEQNANTTFGGQIRTTVANSNTVYTDVYQYTNGTYTGFRQGTANDWNIDTYNGGSYVNALKILQSGNATFVGKVNGARAASNGAGDFAFSLGANDTGIRQDTSGGFNVDLFKSGPGYVNRLNINSDGNATFSGTVEGTTARFDTLNNKANSANIIYRSGTNTVVGSAGTSGFVVQDGGNVGIGTTSPSSKLSNSTILNAAASGLGTTVLGLNWEVPAGASSQGYVASFANTQTAAANANAGVLIEVGSTDTTTRLLSVESGGVNRFEVRGDGNVGIGTNSPSALLTMKDAAYVQEWDRAKGFYQHTTQTGSAAGNFNISTIINTHNLRGLTVDYYESGHYYNNGAATYFRHTRLYIMIESSTLRVGTSVLIQSLGSATGAIVSAPTVTASGTHEATIVSTILSGYTHYVSVDVVGSGFSSFESIS